MKKRSQLSPVTNLILPVLFGLGLFLALFALIQQGIFGSDLVVRYLAGHTVSKVTTALFLIGLASLALIGKDLLGQFLALARITLRTESKPASETEEEDVKAAPAQSEIVQDAIGRLFVHSPKTQQNYLWRRIHLALNFIKRNESSDGLDAELKYAAETDLDEKHDRYALVRIMIWAIPMLGFLGTVLGISEALGGIQIGADNNFQQMMGGLRSSLYVAFDTTALALTFSILLMFVQFGVDRCETGLLSLVDSKAREELSNYWVINNQQRDEYVKTVEKIGSSVLSSTEKLVKKQVKLWNSSIEGAQEAWVSGVQNAQDVVQTELRAAIDQSTSNLGEKLQQVIRESDDAVARRWEQWQIALSENARLLVQHQQHLAECSERLSQAMENVHGIGDIEKLLSGYVQSLPDVTDFSTITKQLATAIRLLEFRLSATEPAPPIKVANSTERAA